MKPFGLVKGVLTVVGLATGLLFSPACKAQSEIDPDHFDGTDSWARVHKVLAARPKQMPAKLHADHLVLHPGRPLLGTGKQNALVAGAANAPVVLRKRNAAAIQAKKQ